MSEEIDPHTAALRKLSEQIDLAARVDDLGDRLGDELTEIKGGISELVRLARLDDDRKNEILKSELRQREISAEARAKRQGFLIGFAEKHLSGPVGHLITALTSAGVAALATWAAQ